MDVAVRLLSKILICAALLLPGLSFSQAQIPLTGVVQTAPGNSVTSFTSTTGTVGSPTVLQNGPTIINPSISGGETFITPLGGATAAPAQTNTWQFLGGPSALYASGTQTTTSEWGPFFWSLGWRIDCTQSSNGCDGFKRNWNLQNGWGGGGFAADFPQITMISASNSYGGNNQPVVSKASGAFRAPLGGFDLNQMDASGAVFSSNLQATTTTNAVGLVGVGNEIDVALGVNAVRRRGIDIVLLGTSEGVGTIDDAAISIGAQTLAAGQWHTIWSIGARLAPVLPFRSSSVMSEIVEPWQVTPTLSLAADRGLDWRAGNFATCPLCFNGAGIDGGGDAYVETLWTNGAVKQGTAVLSSLSCGTDAQGITCGSYFGSTAFPTPFIQAPVASGGTQATATVATMSLSKALVLTPGTGASNGDVLTLAGDTGTEPQVTLNLSSFTGTITSSVGSVDPYGHSYGDTVNVSGLTGAALATQIAGVNSGFPAILSDGGVNICNFSGTGSISGTTLTMSAITYGAIIPPCAINGPTIQANTIVTSGSGSTYTVNQTQTAASGSIVGALYVVSCNTGTGVCRTNLSVPVITSGEAMTLTSVAITAAGSVTAKVANETTTGGTASVQPTFNFGWRIATFNITSAGSKYNCGPPPLVTTGNQNNTRNSVAQITAVMNCTEGPVPLDQMPTLNSLPLILSGTTGSIGGSALTAGQCTSGTAAISGLTTGMDVHATPVTYPGDGIYWEAYTSTGGTATVKVCAVASVTPSASVYNVRANQ